MTIENIRYGAAALLLAAGCAASDNGSPSAHGEGVADVVSALQGAVAMCAAQRVACAGADADAAESNCNDSFESCRAAAQADNAPHLDRVVNECAETSRTCRDAAQTPGAMTACTEQLKSCVGEDRPAPPARPDAGNDGVSEAPVADCIGGLRACLEGDGAPRDCTAALRACVMAAVGNSAGHDGGKPTEPGNSGEPGNPDRPDAGRMDGEPPGADAGVRGEQPAADAGRAPPDAGAASEAMACKTAYEQCLAGGQTREDCARLNRDCRE